MQERKRKDISPQGKSGPALKKTAPGATSRTNASVDDICWEQIADETGWSVSDCLSHKLTFTKRSDAKAKVEPLVQHVKRLRAAGWWLLDQSERCVNSIQHMAVLCVLKLQTDCAAAGNRYTSLFAVRH